MPPKALRAYPLGRGKIVVVDYRVEIAKIDGQSIFTETSGPMAWMVDTTLLPGSCAIVENNK